MATADVVFTMDADVSGAVDGLEKAGESLRSVAGSSNRLSEAMDKLGEDAQSVGARLSSALALGSRNWDELSGKQRAAGLAVNGVAMAAKAAAIGFAGFSAAMVVGLHEAAESEDAARRLTTALQAQGAATQANIATLTSYAESLTDVSRHGSAAITDVAAAGLRLGVPVTQVQAFTKAVLDLSAATGLDLDTAAKQLGGTMDGTAGRLAATVPQVQALTKAQLAHGDAIKLVSDLYGGSSESDASTLSGALAQFRESMGDAAEALAKGVTGSNDLATAIKGARDWVVDAQPRIHDIGVAIGALAGHARTAMEALADLFATGESQFGGSPIGRLEGAQANVDRTKSEIALKRERLSSVLGGAPVSDPTNPNVFMADSERDAEAKRLTLDLIALNRELERNESLVERVKSGLGDVKASIRGGLTGGPGVTDGTGTGVVATTDKVKLTAAQELGIEFAKHVNANERLAEIADDLYATDQDRLAALEAQTDSTASLIEKIRQSVVSEVLKPQAAEEMISALGSSLGGVTQQVVDLVYQESALRVRDMARLSAEELREAMALDAETNAGLDGEAGLSVTDNGQTEAEAASIANREHLLDLQTQEHELRLQIAEQGFSTFDQEMALNDLMWEQAAALDGVITNEERLFHSRERKIAQAEHDRQRVTMGQRAYSMFSQALTNTAGAFIDMAISGEISGKRLLRSTLEDLSQMAKSEAMKELALGLSMMARGSASYGADAGAVKSAGEHFASAAIWGGIGIGAGVAAGAVGGGEGGGGGGGSARDEADDASFGTARRAAMEPVEPAGPRVSLTISGSFIGSNPDDVARHLETYLSESLRDSGGRSGSYRG